MLSLKGFKCFYIFFSSATSLCRKNKFRYVIILIEIENRITDMCKISVENDSIPIYFDNNPITDKTIANMDRNIVATPA